MIPARRKVLAISSGGGHWVELLRIVPAFEGHFLAYATVDEGYREMLPQDAVLHVIPDATRWDKRSMAVSALSITKLLRKTRPDVVVSTGALPGFFAMAAGKALGARTIWLDSLANAEELSMSGQKAKHVADLWLTQWPHLAGPDGPEFAGSVFGALVSP